jgi:hypothetical protein
MCSATRLARFAAAAISALALIGCASTNVGSYVESGANIMPYRTFNWGVAYSISTGDPRLDSNPFFLERLQADVEKQLAGRGLERTTSGTPDLLVHYHASVKQRLDVNSTDRKDGYCRGDDCRPYVYEAGTLLLDLVDAHTNRLVWRGWAEGAVDGMIDNQDWMEKRIDEAVTRILATLPRRL